MPVEQRVSTKAAQGHAVPSVPGFTGRPCGGTALGGFCELFEISSRKNVLRVASRAFGFINSPIVIG